VNVCFDKGGRNVTRGGVGRGYLECVCSMSGSCQGCQCFYVCSHPVFKREVVGLQLDTLAQKVS